jgi:hypothetical protein
MMEEIVISSTRISVENAVHGDITSALMIAVWKCLRPGSVSHVSPEQVTPKIRPRHHVEKDSITQFPGVSHGILHSGHCLVNRFRLDNTAAHLQPEQLEIDQQRTLQRPTIVVAHHKEPLPTMTRQPFEGAPCYHAGLAVAYAVLRIGIGFYLSPVGAWKQHPDSGFKPWANLPSDNPRFLRAASADCSDSE